MGLDMYVYHISKISDEVAYKIRTADYNTINDSEFYEKLGQPVNGIRCCRFDSNPAHNVLIPFCTKIAIPVRYIKEQMLRKDYFIDDDWRHVQSDFSDDKAVYMFESSDSSKKSSVTVSMQELRTKYSYEVKEDYYFFYENEVAYWRGNTELKEQLSDLLGKPVENLRYYPVTVEMMELMKQHEAFAVNPPPEVDHVTSDLFYWSWW